VKINNYILRIIPSGNGMGVRGERKMVINTNHEMAWLGGYLKFHVESCLLVDSSF